MKKQTVNSNQQTAGRICRSRSTFSTTLFFVLLLVCVSGAYAQTCPDPAPQASGSHSFRQQGESFEIPISVADCQTVSLELRWSNGRNNGSNFQVTFLDSENQAIYTKEISGFLSGSFQFPLATLETQPWFGSQSLIAVPVKVTVEAVRPFAFPATISYRVTRVALHTSGSGKPDALSENRQPGNGNGEKMEKAELVGVTDGKNRKP